MSPQAYFNSLLKALLESKEFPAPAPASYTQNFAYMEMQGIRKDMSPRIWKTEIKALAADLTLHTDVLDAGWESFNRGLSSETERLAKPAQKA